MLLAISAPPDTDRGPRFMEKALAAIHQANHSRTPVSLLFTVREGKAGLFIRTADEFAPVVRDYIRSKYPGIAIEELSDEAIEAPTTHGETYTAHPLLSPEIFPLLRHSQFEDLLTRQYEDPIDALCQSVCDDGECVARIEFIAIPAGLQRCRRAKRAVWMLDRPFFEEHPLIAEFVAERITRRWSFLLFPLEMLSRGGKRRLQTETSGSRQHDREGDLQAAFDKLGGHLFDVDIRLTVQTRPGKQHAARRRLDMMAGALGSLTRSRLATFHVGPIRRTEGSPLGLRKSLLSHEELATLWHPPTRGVQGQNLHAAAHVELSAPVELFGEEGDRFPAAAAKTDLAWRQFGFGIDSRRRHLYVVGKTGMGKTTLLRQMIVQDIIAGRGVGVIDPHGDLTNEVLQAIPSNRTNDVIVFNPGAPDGIVTFNPLACSDAGRRDIVADDVVAALDKIYDFSSMPRATDMLRNALVVLIEKSGTLLDLLHFLSDAAERQRYLRSIDDEVVRLYWEREFPSLDKSARSLSIAAILNKIRPFLLSQRMRAIVGQSVNPLDLRRLLDDGKILVVNLSKGLLGEGNANLLGALLVTGLQQAALARAAVSEQQRRDFFLYIDEFQNVTTPSIGTILSEGRKFRLSLVLAHQFLSQLDEKIREAVFGNIGSIVAFQVGAADADTVASQLSRFVGEVHPHHLGNLPKYAAYARVLLEGLPSPPFSLRTFPPIPPADDRSAIVRAASRRRYGQPIDQRQRSLPASRMLAEP